LRIFHSEDEMDIECSQNGIASLEHR
jgi:hypothetical protein